MRSLAAPPGETRRLRAIQSPWMPHGQLVRWGLLCVASAATLLLALLWLEHVLIRRTATVLPVPRPVNVYALVTDSRPVHLTISIDWQKIDRTATVDGVLSDPSLWALMYFDDWDRVPAPLRERALQNMWRRYADVVRAPKEWDAMTPYDWDRVPQPMRAVAFVEMARYWSGYYQVGARFELPRRAVANTLGAIVMAESWFEHRAVSVSRSGNRDLGLGQASDFTRATLARLFREGRIDFAPEGDAGYFDPWHATRMAAIWLDLMIEENDGDLDAAIRAYHRGSPLAQTGEGEEYLANVVRKRSEYMRNASGSPTWTFLMNRLAAIERPERAQTLGGAR